MATLDIRARPAAGWALLVLASAACGDGMTVESVSGTTMGTYYAVTVESDGAVVDTLPIGLLVQAELARVERVMSTYDPDSDVSRFSALRDTEPMPVDPSLLAVLESALEVSRASGGAFDPTVGPLVDAWGFGPDDVLPPDSTSVATLMEAVGYERLVLSEVAGTLAKTDPRTGLDLSGIAKGYAAARIASRLFELGYRHALVDVGGELQALGGHIYRWPWTVALEGPGETEPDVLGTVDLVDEGVATSGDFRNYYEYEGALYSHILDPSTGQPLPYRGFSVSVIHADATLADAWATAFTVLGPDRGLELAEQEGLAVLFAWRTPEGMATRFSSAMEGRVSPLE